MARTDTFEDVSNSMFNFDEFPASDSADGILDSSLNFSNNFNAKTESPTQQRTVSPKDLFTHDPMSEPPSGAFTDLTTPGTSILESPYMANSSETSPFLVDHEAFPDDPDNWPSLFPHHDNMGSAPFLPLQQAASPKVTHVAPKMSRNDSTGQASTRSSHQGRHSFTSGVASKRRDKPLPAIEYDPEDTVAVKRARNTLAARKSREKRMERTEALVSQVDELTAEVEHWKNIALSHGYVE